MLKSDMIDKNEMDKSPNVKLTEAEDVVHLVKLFGSEQIEVWLDGGWGVDALLGEQIRPHNDVDIVIQEKDVTKATLALRKQGYKDIEKNDTRSWNFVLGDEAGREVDVHVINFDAKDNGIYGPKENGVMYPAEALTGTGLINEFPVKCLSAAYQVESHRGYKLREKDFKDVTALCRKFDISLPEEYLS